MSTEFHCKKSCKIYSAPFAVRDDTAMSAAEMKEYTACLEKCRFIKNMFKILDLQKNIKVSIEDIGRIEDMLKKR